MHARWTTPVTQALRSGSVESLRAELLRLLVAGRDLDLRDLLWASRRITTALRGSESTRPPSCGGVRGFGQRTDIRPEEWGFAVVDTVDGPGYQQRSVRTLRGHS